MHAFTHVVECVGGPGRGDCEPPVPEVVGKYMRAKVVASLKVVAAKEKEDAAAEDEDYEEGVADDLSVCCHGRSAAPEVTLTSLLRSAAYFPVRFLA